MKHLFTTTYLRVAALLVASAAIVGAAGGKGYRC